MAYVLGISAFFHDSAAALVKDGEIVAAVQEERFSREKYDERFPARAVAYCLSHAGIGPADLDFVTFYEQPLTKFERLIETYMAYTPAGFASFASAMPSWVLRKLRLPREIRRGLKGEYRGTVLFPSHHQSHAASAFFPSPFDEAAILTMDAVGEWSTTTIGRGRGNRLEITDQIRFPHSLGLLYSAFTYYCGFGVNSGEFKLMGLAPYGEPRYVDLITRNLLDLKPDGSFAMDLSYFNYCAGLTMTGEKFHRLFGGSPRKAESRLEQRHMDLAASVQKVTEDVVLRCARHAWQRAGRPKSLVIAGGVALNCVANGRLLHEGPFEEVWVQPAAGDAGGALGAALFVWHQLLNKPRVTNGHDSMQGALLGPSYATSAAREFLKDVGAQYREFSDEPALLEHVASAIAAGKIVGWFHGRAEFGPRALGARSILADARNTRMQRDLNLKIKYRESFRPFAPSVLREHVHDWFAVPCAQESPYMLLVAPVLERHRLPLSPEAEATMRDDPDLARRVGVVRSTIPAVTHVDYSGRIETVDERHGRFYHLLREFHRQTGCPLLLNTSFNLSWEPIVLTPAEAYHTFMQSQMDVLVLEDCVLEKAEQPLGMSPWAAHPSDANDCKGSSAWADPTTGEPLLARTNCLQNPVTGACYPIVDGIPRLFVSSTYEPGSGPDVTERVKDFYEQSPFPDYDELDTPRALIEKARAGLFARLLNEQLPYDSRVVEVGCGTGQLTNFLSIAHRSVLGVDACLNSLRLAQRFKIEHGLDRAAFAQMDLFHPGLRQDFFDFVISSGVLHHTSDCREAFRRVGALAKPGGYVVVGLYSAFSRKIHDARRLLYRQTGLLSSWLDPHLARMTSAGKRESWISDQYRHPHETCHTLTEVLDWMREDGLEFVNSIPKPEAGPTLLPDERLFERRPCGSRVGRFLSQLADLGNGYREGGFFIAIGRRRTKEAA
jgi:carbamoyltransferase